MFERFRFVPFLFAATLAACSGNTHHTPSGPTPSPSPTGTGATPTPSPTGSGADQYVYYTTLNPTPGGASLGAVQYPVTAASALAFTLDGSNANGLTGAGPLMTDSTGRLWALSGLTTSAPTIGIFATPLASTSTPSVVLTVPFGGGVEANAMAFDPSGNLWVASWNGGAISVYEFTGSFNVSTTLSAAKTVAVPGCTNGSTYFGLAIDSAANLYVTCNGSPSASSVAVLLKSASYKGVSHYLSGLGHPSALAFDARGNLYAGSDSAAPNGGICLYKSGNLGSGAKPDLCDSTGMGAANLPYQFAFDSAGNIYSANCVNEPAGLYVYPTATQALSAGLAPSAVYSDANVEASGCVAGVAIR